MACDSAAVQQSPRVRKACGRRALVASAAAAAALALALFCWATQPSPAIVPTRVLVDGGGDSGELVATLEAEYNDAASWHSTGIDGGSCSLLGCGGTCPLLRGAVLRPRRLDAQRVSIDVVVSELWPRRARQALESGGILECTLAAHIDVFRTGWRVQRELRWSLASGEGPASISVRPQRVVPGVEGSAVAVNASYLLEVGLSAGSALGSLLRAVPVAVRAELGYVEEQEGALHGRVAVDAALRVTEADGRVVVLLPFTTRTSASIPSLMRCAARAPAAGAERAERALVFAVAPGAAATASLLGGRHTVAWSRTLSFSAPERSRRLAVRRLLDVDLSELPAVHDAILLHRFLFDDEALEVLVAVSGGEPAQATLRVRIGALGGVWTDLMSVTVRTDRLLEPIATFGGEAQDLKTELGTFATSTEGDTQVTSWSSPPDMHAKVTQRGDDFSISALLPGNMTAALERAGGTVTGSLAQGSAVIATLTLAVQQAAGSEDYVLTGPLLLPSDPTVLEEPLQVSATVKPAQKLGGAVVARLENPSGWMSVDAKFEVADFGAVSSHALLEDSTNGPVIDFKLSVDVVEPACGRIVSTMDMMGSRAFSADAGCARSATSGDMDMHLVVKTVDTAPALANASLDFDSDPVYGGKLVAFGEMLGEPLFRVWLAAGEAAEWRSVDVNLTMGADASVLGCSLQHTRPDAADVSINATVLTDGTPVGKGSIWGKALDQVLATETAEDGRRELVLAAPGAWGASMSMPADGGAMVEAMSLGASIAQVGSLLTLEVAVPTQLGLTLLADSSSAGVVLVNATLTSYGDGGSTSTLSAGGRMERSGPTSSGALLLDGQRVDLVVSRGFLPSLDSTYSFSVSAAADLSSSLGVVVDLRAYFQTFADWGLAGAGWGLSLRADGLAMLQVVGLDMAMPTPEGAQSVAGSMTVEVEGDVAAFLADTVVKMGFGQAIADIVAVPASAVTVALSAARRLGETRRLGGAVKVDYNITMPAGHDATAAAAAISATPPAEMALAVSKAIATASGGASKYSMTIMEASAPQVRDITEASAPQVHETEEVEVASKAAGAFGASALLLAAVGCLAA